MGRRGPQSTADLRTAPALRVVQTSRQQSPPPPDHLSREMKKWWTSVQSEYVLNAHHNLLLEAACGCWDRSTAAGKVLDAEGLTYTDDHGKIVRRPEISIEREQNRVCASVARA